MFCKIVQIDFKGEKMKKLKYLTASIVAAAAFVGCGGGSDSSTPVDTTQTGTFVDAPVVGLHYKTASKAGYTDENGKFKYKVGEEVEFKLGNLLLGKVQAGTVISPYDLSDGNVTLATNIALILQNFDANRSDGVLELTQLKDYNFTGIDLNASSSTLETAILNFINNNSNYVDPNAILIDAATVKSKMDQEIAEAKLVLEKMFTVEYLNGKTFDRYAVEPGATRERFTFNLSQSQQFLDENVNPPVTRTGYQALDGMITIVDGKIYEYTFTTDSSGNPRYNDGVNIYTVKSVDSEKIVCDMEYPGGTLVTYFYFVP